MKKIYSDVDEYFRLSEDGKRVFIGGDYDHMAVLEKISEAVRNLTREFKLYPIIAYEIKIPFYDIYRIDMFLLEKCDYALFDITSPAGQLLELERAKRFLEEGKDFKIGIFFQARCPTEVLLHDIIGNESTPGQVTSMVTGFYELYQSAPEKVLIQGYEDFEQLRRLINILIRG